MNNPLNIFKEKENSMVGVLNELCTNTLPSKIQAMAQSGQLNRMNYMAIIRHSLNNALIELTFGCQIDKGDSKTKIKFNKPLPTIADIQRASSILAMYMGQYENSLMQRFTEAEAAAGINPQGVPMNMNILPEDMSGAKRVFMVQKVDNKHLKEMLKQPGVLGSDILTPADILQLSAMGAEARKKHNTKVAIIVGTTIIIVGAATVAGVIIYQKKKEEQEYLATLQEDVMIDTSTIDANIPTVNPTEFNLPSLTNSSLNAVPQVQLK